MSFASDAAVPAQVLFELLRAMNISSTAVALYMIRFVAAMAVLPVMGEQIINNMSRMGIAMLLAVFASFGHPWNELTAMSGAHIGLIAVKEAIVGVALGFAMSTVFWAIEFAGALIDTDAGFNSVQMTNPLSDSQSTPVSDTLVRLAGAVFYSLGGAIYFAQAMFDSFVVWPVIDLAPSADGAYRVFIERHVGDLFANTLKLAAPVLTILMLIDFGVGLLSRSAEKLEPASLSQPIKGVVAILVLIVFVSVAFDQMRHYLLPRGITSQLLPATGLPSK